MVCVHIIDNILCLPTRRKKISTSLAKQICALIRENMVYENREATYAGTDMARLLHNKTPELIRERLEEGILVYLTDQEGVLVGCGMVEFKDSHYEAKTLHIHRRFRRQGYAQLICDLRERTLLNHGIPRLFIESLKFENTIRFHTARGFSPFDDGKPRKYSLLMKKELT